MKKSVHRKVKRLPYTLFWLQTSKTYGSMGVSVGGQADMSPLLFELEGTPCVLSPLLSGGWHFCNAQLHNYNYGLQFI